MSAVAEEPKLSVAEVFRAASEEFLARMRFSQAMGLTFDGKRDLAKAFGYKDDISIQDYRIRYERGGIAGRIVDAIAKATWRGGCELIEDENPDVETPFEQAWRSLDDRLNIVAEMQAADILSRIGSYSVILIGDGEDVTKELKKGNGNPDGLIYFSPYCGSEMGLARGPQRTFTEAIQGLSTANVLIDSFEKDPKNPRFAQPAGYRLQRTEFLDSATDFSNKVVHWTRVVHFAEAGLDNKVFGTPGLKRSWNDLDNLDKVVGGGAEAFFQRANQGRLWSIDKDIVKLDPGELENFRKQIEDFQHNIVRDVRGRGVTVDTLSSDVANFAAQMDGIITLLAGTNEIPKRILTGSEMGELASSQDRDNWRDQVNGRRENYATPFMVRRLVNRLIDFNWLPKPKQYMPKWGSVLNMTEEEKKNKALGMAQVNQTNKSIIFLDSEIRQLSYEMAPLTKQQIEADQAIQPEPPAPAVPAAGFPRAARFREDEARDSHGRWTDGGGDGFVASPSDALISLAKGEKATVSAEDARGVVEKAAEQGAGPIDLTNLTIEGTPIFAGGLNRPRDTMPQIPKEHQEQFLESLDHQGISVTYESVRPAKLLPSQSEIDAVRVGQKLQEYDKGHKDLRPAMVSQDNYVLDGHHRWATMAIVDVESPKLKIKMPIIRLGMDHKQALRTMLRYTKKTGIANRALVERLAMALETNDTKTVDEILGVDRGE